MHSSLNVTLHLIYVQVSSEPELSSKPNESENQVEEAVSMSSALVAEGSNDNSIDTCMPENGDITSQFDPSVPAAASAKKESDQVNGELNLDDARNSSDSVDVKPDDQQAIATSHVHHGLGETSFSAVGHVSSRITCVDPVPYSGSISLRSDSSTTSARSFAFPVYENYYKLGPKACHFENNLRACMAFGYQVLLNDYTTCI